MSTAAQKHFVSICLEAGRAAMVEKLSTSFGPLTNRVVESYTDEEIAEVLWGFFCIDNDTKQPVEEQAL